MLTAHSHRQISNAVLLHKKPEPTGFWKGRAREKKKMAGAREALST